MLQRGPTARELRPEPDACPAGSPTATATAVPTPAALRWTDTVCTALDPVIGTLKSPPNPDVDNLGATRQSYLTYLETATRQADAAQQQITTVGPPPVAGGDQISSRIGDQVTQLGTDIDQARGQIQQTDPNDAASITQALTAAGNVGSSLVQTRQLLSTLRQNAQLAQAVDQSPSCASLRSVGGVS